MIPFFVSRSVDKVNVLNMRKDLGILYGHFAAIQPVIEEGGESEFGEGKED